MDTRIVPFADVKDASRQAVASLNDVFVATITDALVRYHHHLGAACPRLRLHMPVNSRTDRTASLAGNQFVPARISLQLARKAETSAVENVRQQLRRLGEEPALHHINPISAAIQRLGKPISRWIIGGMMKGVDVLASNVPGPTFPLYLAGARIEQFYAFGPPAGASLNVTLFSYDGNVGLGITTDAAAVAERSLFLACLDEAIAEVIGGEAGTAASDGAMVASG